MPTETLTPWEFTPYVAEPTRITISALLWALHDNGGSFEHEQGLAGPALRELAIANGMFIHPSYRQESSTGGTKLSTLYGALEKGTYGKIAIERDTRGTRTYEIKLLLEDEEMPPRPVMVTRTLGDSTKPVEHPVDVSARDMGVGPVEVVEHVEVEHLEDGWDDIDTEPDIDTLPAVITVSDTPAPYGLVLDAQRAITRALVLLAKDMPPPADHVELIALRARVGQLTQELTSVLAERDRLTEILNTIASADTSMNGDAS